MKQCMVTYIGIVLLFVMAIPSGVFAAEPLNVELIIDASGSMAAKMEGKSKMAIAKDVMLGLAVDLPRDAQVAIRTYGNHRKDDCSDLSLIASFGSNDVARFRNEVQALQPKGMTPISGSLEAAGRDFAGKEGQHNLVILVSDGQETCHADPCAAAKALHKAGIHLEVNVIGFDVNAEQRKQLECIANVSGGKYYNASTAGEFKLAASDVKERIAATPAPEPYVKKGEPLYGDPTRGGDSYETAVVIPIGKLFHLDHEQPKGLYDFFSVSARGGQTILVSITTGPSSAYAGAGAMINDTKRQKLAEGDVSGARSKTEVRRDIADQQDGTYYVLIGSGYNTQNQDATFQVDLVNNSDANSDRDAGSDEARALEITPGAYEHNYMSDSEVDQMDVFKFKAEQGKVYQFKARAINPEASIELQAIDSDGAILGKGESPNKGAAAKLENLKLAQPGDVYVKVSYYHYGAKGVYSFTLVQGDAEAQSPPGTVGLDLIATRGGLLP